MAEMEAGICLVDFDNVALAQKKDREWSEREVPIVLSSIFDRLGASISRYLPAVTEVEARFYGGWLDQSGQYMPLAQWILAELSAYRSVRKGIRFFPELTTSIADYPKALLVGTCRTDSRKKRQKMVDAMIVVDAVHFARLDGARVMMVSNDQDLVPAAVVAQLLTPDKSVLWLRESTAGGPNDETLIALKVMLGEFA